MSEAAKVRLVRCPKCDNLLPEVTNYSVYQCGGCGAVLRAKNKGVDLDSFSETSDEGKLSNRYGKMIISEKRTMDLGDGSESDSGSIISSSSRVERRKVLRGRAEVYSSGLMTKKESLDFQADENQYKRSDERMRIAQDFPDPTKYDKDENLQRARRLVDERNGEISEDEFLWRAQRRDDEIMRYSRDDFSRNKNVVNVSENADYVGEDRMVLLRKLDELNGSGNLMGKGKEKIPHDRDFARTDPYVFENRYPDSYLGTNRASGQLSYPETMVRRQRYPNQYTEPTSLMHREDRDGNGFYPPRYAPNHAQGYEDPLRSHMVRKGSNQNPVSYQQPLSHPYDSRPYMDDGMSNKDYMEPHHPKTWMKQTPPPSQPLIYNDRYSDIPNNRTFGYHETPGSFASQDYNPRFSDPFLRSHNPPSHSRYPSDINSEVDALIRRRPPRVHLASGGQRCCPLANGAPLFTCCNCFEVLLLPKQGLTKNNKRKKVKCGACSTIILCVVSDKKLLLSVDDGTIDTLTKVDEQYDEPSYNGDAHLKQGKTTFSSNGYDSSGYDFRSNKSNQMNNHYSSNTYTSDVEEDEESLTNARKDADLKIKDKGSRPHAGSPLQNHFEFPNKSHSGNRSVEGNRSGRSEHVQELTKDIAARHISRNESSATEIDLSSNEYCNTGTTFDSGEGSREGDQLKGNKVANSFFGGITKKCYEDSNRSSDFTDESEKASVIINGHLIPDRLIKKAEKKAGPVQPGNYWYDFRAGFWGALGGPCLGIVPPFIEVFNYPMAEDCSGGNTNVFVNGRELSQKDLKLLGSRGLPTEGDRSYIVELSGRVLDEDTGEELQSLGKLAPTVEKLKRGFGMKDPNAVAN